VFAVTRPESSACGASCSAFDFRRP
jgi:hypothetical protein